MVSSPFMVMVVEAALVLATEEAPGPDQLANTKHELLGVADIPTEALQAWDEVPEGEVVPLLSLLTVSE